MASKEEIIECLACRVGDYHRMATVSIGTGNVDADVITIQPYIKFAPRDAITGALKKFDMLNDTYRATSKVVDFHLPHKQIDQYPQIAREATGGWKPRTQDQINRYYLRELIQIVKPLMVIVCGTEPASLLTERKIRVVGKTFSIEDIPNVTFYSTINPADYGFAKGDPAMKARGIQEWTALSVVYKKLKEKQERERWI